jgi:hypothetical protein
MDKMVKLLATVVFALFGILGIHSVVSLGFGWYGAVAVLVIVGAFLYELWFVSYNYSQYKKGVLQTIEGYRGEVINPPQNLMDAKDMVAMLKEDREILAEAYISLYKENKALGREKDTE